MALLPYAVQQSLRSLSFIDEFQMNEQKYLDLVSTISRDFTNMCQQFNISVTLNPKEDYAEQHLIDKTVIWLLSDNAFTYFRKALRRGRRKYIPPADYQLWAAMMARYVLREAVTKGNI